MNGARSAQGMFPRPYTPVARLSTESLAPVAVVLNSPEQGIEATLRPVFGHAWQALGKKICSLYDAGGKCVPPRDDQID